jgi:hypothetical protein
MTTYKRIEAVNKTVGIPRYLADQKVPTPWANVDRTVKLPMGTDMCHPVSLEDGRFIRRIVEGLWDTGAGDYDDLPDPNGWRPGINDLTVTEE